MERKRDMKKNDKDAKNMTVAEIANTLEEGTLLYSPLCGDCTLIGVGEYYGVKIVVQKYVNDVACTIEFDENGIYYTQNYWSQVGECLIFPDREMHDWKKTMWKKGDILVSEDGKTEIMFDHYENGFKTFVGSYAVLFDSNGNMNVKKVRLERKVIDFKIENALQATEYMNSIHSYQNTNRFKPFDKVLVRDKGICNVWRADFFSNMQGNGMYYHCTSNNSYNECIPYDGNEHLLGTSNEPSYK